MVIEGNHERKEKIIMKELTVKNIVEVTKGKLVIGNDDMICKEFSKDTRTIKENDTYIAIRGENFDGNKFWKDALNKGAQAVIINSDVEIPEEDLNEFQVAEKAIIKVDDTIDALQRMASFKRDMYNIPIIAVTGSVGKTSTKDLISSTLSTKYKVLKTEGNTNNEIGMPLTLLRLNDSHEVAVIEMGMNHFGEISLLSKIAKPTLAVITNVGSSHIGNLGSRENILKAKLEIVDGMENKIIIINNDNDLLHKWNQENNDDIQIITYGIQNESQFEAKEINAKEDGTEFICKTENDEMKVFVSVPGEHFVYNSLCAIVVGKQVGIPEDKIKEGISNIELTKKRMEIIKLKNGATIINDSYNASYESTKAALEYLGKKESTRKIAVLGDMFELGEFSEEYHKKVGEEVVKNNIDILICSGDASKHIVNTAKINGMKEENIYFENDIEATKNRLIEVMKSGDDILVKASQGMKFFKIVEEIIANNL